MNVTTAIVAVIMLAIITEYLTNILKPVMPKSTYPIALLISMVVGIGLATLTSVDVLQALGFHVAIPVVGQIVTGLIASGGSSAVHELIEKLRSSRTNDAS